MTCLQRHASRDCATFKRHDNKEQLRFIYATRTFEKTK